MISFRKPHFIAAAVLAATAAFAMPLCSRAKGTAAGADRVHPLTDSIAKIAAEYPGEIGVAVIIDSKDTVAVNNRSVYPMMSVFKLHQALAVCEEFDRRGISLDTVLNLCSDELDPDTWSPMLKEHPEGVISLRVSELMRYTLTQSDNNASNYMFRHLVDTQQTDAFISTLIPRQSFRIVYREDEMSADHSRAYGNYTSPLGAAGLINRLFTDSIVSGDKQRFVMTTLGECTTGTDRIVAPLLDKPGVKVAHKTGSGYSENGVLAAHNDVAYVRLPDGRGYSLAVFVKDIKGDETLAARAIARISAAVYSFVTQKDK